MNHYSVTIRCIGRWSWSVVIHTDGLRFHWSGFEKRRDALAFIIEELS